MLATKIFLAKMFTVKLPRTQQQYFLKTLVSGIQYHTGGIFATVGIFADLKVTDGNKKIQGEIRQKSSIKAVYNDLPSQRIYSLIQWKEMIDNDLNWWRIQK